jgi:cysteine desulfuration protein SufE
MPGKGSIRRTGVASQRFEDIAADFEFLDDWEDRYRYVIELGKAMPPFEPALRSPATKVDGCASQVWIAPLVSGQGAPAVFDFKGDSDAMIVRGLIAVLHALYSGQRIDAVLATDAHAELSRLGLEQHLTAQRSNGLRAMVGRIRAIAQAALLDA